MDDLSNGTHAHRVAGSRAAQAGSRPQIRRGERARERVVRAALAVLADHGVPGFTMEAIAHRARASKATLYRHWESPAALLVDAMGSTFRPMPLPSTGNVRTDLIDLLSKFQELVSGQPFPRLMATFMDAAEREPVLKTLHTQITDQRREPIRHILVRARERGEISSTTDIELAVDLLAGPAFYRRFVAHGAFPDRYAAAVVDCVLTAIGYRPASAAPPRRQKRVPL